MKHRNYYFDNGRFILILLVVFGHLIQPYTDDHKEIYALYQTIFTFHMPAFILISGFFAKNFRQKGYLWKITKKLILPYLIFQLIYSVYYYFLLEESQFTFDPLDPHWSLWFLLSSFFWHLLLFVFSKLKAVNGLLLAFFIGIAVGYVEWISNYLSFSRTLVFFPLFLLGYYLKKEHFEVLSKPRIKLFSIGFIFIVFISFYYYPMMNDQWLLGSKSYEVMGDTSFLASLKRLGIYFLNLVMIICFFSIVPRKHYFYTELGRRTLYVYLLHGFFIKYFRESNLHEHLNESERFVFLPFIAIILTLVLSSQWVISMTQPFMEMKGNAYREQLHRGKVLLRYYRRKFHNLHIS